MGTAPRVKECGNLPLRINGHELDRTKTYKYLGITLDQHLTYRAHLSTLNGTVRHKIYLLRTVRPYLTEYAALQVYRQMILPILEYGNALYASAPKSCLDKLQRAQNSGLKAVYGLPKRTPTAALHDKANLDKLDKRR